MKISKIKLINQSLNDSHYDFEIVENEIIKKASITFLPQKTVLTGDFGDIVYRQSNWKKLTIEEWINGIQDNEWICLYEFSQERALDLLEQDTIKFISDIRKVYKDELEENEFYLYTVKLEEFVFSLDSHDNLNSYDNFFRAYEQLFFDYRDDVLKDFEEFEKRPRSDFIVLKKDIVKAFHVTQALEEKIKEIRKE